MKSVGMITEESEWSPHLLSIGMCDRPFSIADRADIVDVTAFNYGDDKVESKVRDCQRTPMQWSSKAPHAGFTSATTKPFLPLADTWPELNVEEQQQVVRSHVKLFQQLTRLRQQTPFYGGHQKKVTATKEVYAFVRWLETSVYLIVINVNPIGHEAVKLKMTKLLKYAGKELSEKSLLSRATSPMLPRSVKKDIESI